MFHKTFICSLSITAVLFYFTNGTVFAQDPGTWLRLPTTESINALVTTPYAIYAGQYALSPSYNGLYTSKDLGMTWVKAGLTNRGIRDIAYSDGIVYACTYYTVDGTSGLFISSDKGVSWQQKGPNYSCTKLFVSGNRVLLGTRNNGVLLSENAGQSFSPVLELTGIDREVVGIYCTKGTCFASTLSKAYRSENNGTSWSEMPPLLYKNAEYFASLNDLFLAGTKYGLYKSTDKGKTWELFTQWGSTQIGMVIVYSNVIYAAKRETNATYQVYKSADSALSWESTNMVTPQNIPPIKGSTAVYSKPAYLFTAGFGSGIQRYMINPYKNTEQAFLGPLWENSTFGKQIQTITSYFDHIYPLLGYLWHTEPDEDSSTTTNFLGVTESQPAMYYSGHDGYDFGLSYGTKIIAPASGLATYTYSSLGGNVIRIDHHNGYQTSYLHLQRNGLYTTNSTPVEINKGDQIGLVGLTGNTSGPHLHFSVLADKNGDESFVDDYVDGRTDPYSWQSLKMEDPWEKYLWNDSTGLHNGTKSPFLWESDFPNVSSHIGQGQSLVIEEFPLRVEIQTGSLSDPVTVEISPWTGVNNLLLPENLQALLTTSFKISALNYLNQNLPSFNIPVNIILDLSEEDLSNFDLTTLKIAYFDYQQGVWEFLPSVWDPVSKKLETVSSQLTDFIAVGEKTDRIPPESKLAITGKKTENWYIEYPVIEVSAEDVDGSAVSKSFYSLDGGTSWEEYLTPISLQKEGIFALLYRSSDTAQNYEAVKESSLLRVDTLGKNKDEIIWNGVKFSTFSM